MNHCVGIIKAEKSGKLAAYKKKKQKKEKKIKIFRKIW